MIETKKECKTIIDIVLTEADLEEIVDSYGSRESDGIIYPETRFDGLNRNNLVGSFRCVGVSGLQYVADFYGYDGWCNSGYAKNGTYHMQVFVWGSCL